MSKFKNYLLFITVLAVAGAVIGSQAHAWKEPEQSILPVSIDLDDIVKNPHALKDKPVTFLARFATRGNVFREKDDNFTSDKFENFSVWKKDVPFWNEVELKKVYPTLHIAKDNKQLSDRLIGIKQFDKVEITGVVVSMYANMPWINVTDIRVLNEDELDQPMASQVARGARFIDNNDFQKARICFEIAQERRVPAYVTDYINSRLSEIETIQKKIEDDNRKQIARQLLEQARNHAKDGAFEKAATTYGKALKASSEYNSSSDIHKEIAGFFIDFYRSRNEIELLDYSINEFQIAQKIIGEKDSDILYALAYIETLKAKVSHNYTKAEALARECLKVNAHNYNGRKLLSDIITCQLTAQPVKQIHKDEVILPVAPKKRIKLPKITADEDMDIAVKIDDMINEKELAALQTEVEDIDNIFQEDASRKTFAKVQNPAEHVTEIPRIKADDLIKSLDNLETDITEIELEKEILTDQEPELPDFPVGPSDSRIPDLAL